MSVSFSFVIVEDLPNKFWNNLKILKWKLYLCRSQEPRGLRRRSAAARLLRSWVRIPPGAWMFVSCECCALPGRCLCDELITRPEESYRMWCVVVCDQETSRMRRPWPAIGRSATEKNLYLKVSLKFWNTKVVAMRKLCFFLSLTVT